MLNNTTAQLDSAFRSLAQRWADTKTVWDDSVQRDFEKEYWEPLEAQIRSTQQEMERLAQVIAQAQRNVK
ncbi:MAG: hypothetical protein HY258_10760 [Chloroflexi bacterium]|nr:hypothetical protein [Chloroflexota bacterium]